MATDSPKIPGYVPQVVYDQLMQLKADRGLKSVSMAVTVVLQEYFNLRRGKTRVRATRGKVKEWRKSQPPSQDFSISNTNHYFA